MKTLEDFKQFDEHNPVRQLMKMLDKYFTIDEILLLYQYAKRFENSDGLIRKEVLEFAQDMEIKLKENDDKEGWKGESFEYLFANLQEEVHELSRYFDKNVAYKWITKDEIIRECADIANFAMMIADKCRE